VLVFILHREGHLDQPIDAANAKRSISSAPLPIAEDVYQLEIRVVYLDGAVVKVGRVQEPEGLGDGQAFVDWAQSWIVNHADSAVEIHLGLQPLMVPSSVANRNRAEAETPLAAMMKSLTPWLAPSGSGMVTINGPCFGWPDKAQRHQYRCRQPKMD
jgi:hypothetical protein